MAWIFPLILYLKKKLLPLRNLFFQMPQPRGVFTPSIGKLSIWHTSLFFHPKREAGEGEGADGPPQSWSLTFLPFWLTWTPCRPAAHGWKTCRLRGPLTHPCSTSTAHTAWVIFGDTGFTTLQELLFFFLASFFAKLCLIYTVNKT